MAKSKIIREIVNNEISISIALARLLVIASDINNSELSQWIEKELDGYKITDTIPEYRITKTANFRYDGIKDGYPITDAPIQLMQILCESDRNVLSIPINYSIYIIEDIIKQHGVYYILDFTKFAGMVYSKNKNIQCSSIRCLISKNEFKNIVNYLKTILIKIFVELDRRFETLDKLDIDTTGTTNEQLHDMNTIINNFITIDNSINIGDKNKIDTSTIGVGNEKRG